MVEERATIDLKYSLILNAKERRRATVLCKQVIKAGFFNIGLHRSSIDSAENLYLYWTVSPVDYINRKNAMKVEIGDVRRRTAIVAAATAIAALIAIDPAIAKSSSSSGVHPNYGGTSDNFDPWATGAPSYGSTRCSKILASPRSHPRGQVEYCRSIERQQLPDSFSSADGGGGA